MKKSVRDKPACRFLGGLLFLSVLFISACTRLDIPLSTAQATFNGNTTTATLSEAVQTTASSELPGEGDAANLSASYNCIPAQAEGQWAQVIEVIDGDTITVELGGSMHKVRYIGINAPEMDEPLGMDARVSNQGLVKGKDVYLLKDTSETDQYGRLLRYVFTSDAFVNYELVRKGYALRLPYPPDTACDGLFQDAEASARTDALGLWQSLPAANDPSTDIRISAVFYDGVQGDNEPDEYVAIENTGSQSVDLTHWYLKDQGTHKFVFPSIQIEPGQVCRVYTNQDHPEYCGLNFKESSSAVWNNGGDCAFLFKPDGLLVAEYCY